MIWSEIRGVLAVAAVGLAIVVCAGYLLDYDGDDAEASVTATTVATTVPPTTTEARALLSGLESIVELCALANDFKDGAESEVFVYPGKLQQIAEEFYTVAIDLVDGNVRAEYAAALSYYEDFNEIGEPDNYDALTLLRGPNADRFRQLATREPPGVEATRANVAFLCEGLEIPGAPLMNQGEFDRLQDIVDKEQGKTNT